jgi:hypothetical protein
MKTFKVSATIKIADVWIEDGFNLNEKSFKNQLKEGIQDMIPHAYEHEIKVEDINIITE